MTRYLTFLALFAVLWAVLTGGSPLSWVVGVPVAAGAAALAVWLGPGSGRAVRPVAAAVFAGFFLVESLRGGWDIARRAVHPALPIDPGQLTYRLRLPPGTPRVLFANTVSLLPGTLSLEIGEEVLHVHAVDQRMPIRASLARLEERIAALYGLSLRGEAEP